MNVEYIAINDLRPAKEQSPDRIKDVNLLARSIARVGILQPIIVRKVDGKELRAEDPGYEIVAGNRRVAAAKLAGLKLVPALVFPSDASHAQVIRITENLHRQQLNAMEEAQAIATLQGMKRTTEEIAADLGMTPSYVARRARLLFEARTGADATRIIPKLGPLFGMLGLIRQHLEETAAADIPDRHGLLKPAPKPTTKPPRSPKVQSKGNPEPKTTAKPQKAAKGAKRG